MHSRNKTYNPDGAPPGFVPDNVSQDLFRNLMNDRIQAPLIVKEKFNIPKIKRKTEENPEQYDLSQSLV